MTTYRVPVECIVEIEINNPDVIERVTGPLGDGWRSYAYDLHTKEDVLAHLAHAAVVTGADSAETLDGWADLPREACRMRVVEATPLPAPGSGEGQP